MTTIAWILAGAIVLNLVLSLINFILLTAVARVVLMTYKRGK